MAHKLWPVITLSLSLSLFLILTHSIVDMHIVYSVRPPLFARSAQPHIHFSVVYLLHDVFIQSTSPLSSRKHTPSQKHTHNIYIHSISFAVPCAYLPPPVVIISLMRARTYTHTHTHTKDDKTTRRWSVARTCHVYTHATTTTTYGGIHCQRRMWL